MTERLPQGATQAEREDYFFRAGAYAQWLVGQGARSEPNQRLKLVLERFPDLGEDGVKRPVLNTVIFAIMPGPGGIP